jgi:hypothetical protein
MLERHVIQRRPTTKENSSSKHSLQENAIGHWQQPLDPSSMDLMMLKQLVNTALAKAMYAMHTSFHSLEQWLSIATWLYHLLPILI